MGSEKVTVQNLKIVSVDLENNLILIQGSIPGATGSRVMLRPSKGEKVELPAAEESHPQESQPAESQPAESQPQENKAKEPK